MKNELKHLAEFKKILETYEMNGEAKRGLSECRFIALTAPSSVGRNTIIRELMKTGMYHFVVSDTTRNPRINDGVPEQNGIEYWFKNEEDYLKALKEGRYIESAVIHNQQVSGVSYDEIAKANANNLIAITDIEVQGIESIRLVKPDIIAIFVLPPSLDEWMKRLKNRGQMPNDEIKRRLESAVKEFDYAIEKDVFTYLINDEFHDSVKKINHIVHDNIADINYQKAAKILILDLRTDVRNLLSTLD
jgi:guanylate kinase